MNAVLVTGGAGFFGASPVPMLLGQGYRVRVLDGLSVGSTATLEELDVELMVGDIRDRAAVD